MEYFLNVGCTGLYVKLKTKGILPHLLPRFVKLVLVVYISRSFDLLFKETLTL